MKIRCSQESKFVLKFWRKCVYFEHWTPAMKLIFFGMIEELLLHAVETFCISDTTEGSII